MGLPLVIALALAICAAGHDVSFVPGRILHQCRSKDANMNPVYEVLHGQDTVWQIPRNPKAILFVAHGMKSDPFSYFDPCLKCHKCRGLPEHRAVTLDALRWGYAVISVKSIGASYDSWPLETSQDLVVVGNILHDWRLEHSLDGLPWVFFGSSAGGFFTTSLTTRIPTLALLLMYSEGQAEVIENATPEAFPPTFFVYGGGERDAVAKLGDDSNATTTKEDIEETMAILIERGVRVDGKCLPPRPVTPHFFTERIRCMTGDESEKIQRAYKAEGWLDGENYVTLYPPDADWTVPLLKWNALPVWYELSQACGLDAVCEELTRAHSFHGCNGDADEEMFSWVDSVLAFSDIPTDIEEFHASH